MLTSCVVLAGVALAHQGRAYLALQRLADGEWIEAAAPQEIRRAARTSLDLWFVEPHDAMIWLGRHGTPEDVSLIIAELRRVGVTEGEPQSCTWAHAYSAIEEINARHPTGSS